MARFDDLPIEIVEQVALELSQLPPEPSRYGGLAIRNPVTGRAFSSSKDPLLNFSKVSRDCRMACVRYFPSLVHTIHATSFGDLHQLRQDYNARTRVAPYVKHIVLDFQVPLLDVRALKLGMSVLCQVPGMVSLPHLAGLSFSSRFIHSFYGHINHQRVSRQYRQLAEEMGNWQGSLLAGIAGLGSVVTRGGQSLGKFGDAEVLFLKGTWTQEQGEVLMKHDPPPIEVLRSSTDPLHMLITTFPPSSFSTPPIGHPIFLATMYIAGSLVGSDKSYTATPLRSYPPDERAAHAYELGPFDEEARRYQARSYYDEMTTATLARAFIEKHCFQPLEPEVIDSVLPLLQQQSNRAVAKAS